MLQEVSEASISSKIIQDEDLSFNQWSEGKNRFLLCIRDSGWDKEEVDEMARFFLNLDSDPLRSESLGLQAVLRYCHGHGNFQDDFI